VKRFRGGLVFKAHRLVYHSTLSSRVIKKEKKNPKPQVLTLQAPGSARSLKDQGGGGAGTPGSAPSSATHPGDVPSYMREVFFFFFITLKPRVE